MWDRALRALTHHVGMSLGEPDLQQSCATEPGWSSGRGCVVAWQHPERKKHSPGSDCRVNAHPHTMFEINCFSLPLVTRDTVLSNQDLPPGSTPALPVSASQHGDVSASKLPDKSSSQHQTHSGLLTSSKTNHPIRRIRRYMTSQCYRLSTGCKHRGDKELV